MTSCPENRWPSQKPNTIKLLWLSGDMAQGGCSRYTRDLLHILQQCPIEIEVIWFQDHHFDAFTNEQLSALAPVSRYDPETFYAKVAAADLVTSMNLNKWVQDRDRVIASTEGKLFCQLHGTCEYTKEIVAAHSPFTKHFMACSKRASKLLNPDDSVMVSPVPIDFNRVTRQRPKKLAKTLLGLSPEEKVVTYAGRISYEKGLLRICETIKELPPEVKFLCVGNGYNEAELLPQMKNLLGDRMIHKGWVSHPTDYLDATDVFLVQSDYEGVPLVLVEALCHGTPVVSVDVGVAYDYVIKLPGKRPFNAVYAFTGPETVLEALECRDLEQSAAILEALHLEHNQGRIRDQWMNWLRWLNANK